MIRQPGLTLIQDALNRGKRTLAQQVVVLATDVAILLALDVSDLEGWQVVLVVLYHLAASVVASYVHRTALDPSSLPSLAPPETPSFRQAPLEAPVPLE